MFKRISLLLCFVLYLVAALSAAPASARTTIIVLPPDYAGDKAQLIARFGEAILTLDPSDTIMVYPARGAQLATIRIPQDPNVSNRAWLRRKLGEQFAPVLQAIATLPPAPGDGDISSNLNIPDRLDDLGRNVIPTLPDKKANIVLIGSWIYFDKRDARFVMTDRFYPADSHLRARPSETPFGVAGHTRRLNGAEVHFCWPGGETEFATKQHEEMVRRFWSLFVQAQGGRIGTFSFDPGVCIKRALAGETSGQTVYEAARDAKDAKLEMLRARAPVPATLPASMARPGEYFLRDDVPISHTPPTTTVGIAWIGIKWTAPCDLDLYARGEATKPWLFFANVHSEEGHFNHDFQDATGEKQFEFNEFIKPIDLAKAEVAINLYAGDLPTPPEGVIRVWFGGQVYEAPFKLTATRGNKGAQPIGGGNWVRIDLRKVVGLTPS